MCRFAISGSVNCVGIFRCYVVLHIARDAVQAGGQGRGVLAHIHVNRTCAFEDGGCTCLVELDDLIAVFGGGDSAGVRAAVVDVTDVLSGGRVGETSVGLVRVLKRHIGGLANQQSQFFYRLCGQVFAVEQETWCRLRLNGVSVGCTDRAVSVVAVKSGCDRTCYFASQFLIN